MNSLDINTQGALNTIDCDTLYEVATKYIKPDSDVLNLGCGNYTFEKVLLRKYPMRVSIDSLDINLPLVSFCHEAICFSLQNVEVLFDREKKYDYVTFFELIEHIDRTDELLKNCYNNLKDDGVLIFSFPNLSSIYARIELLLGFQPHILEVSNESAYFGSGIFGRLNGDGTTVHHIRGITSYAMKELVEYHGFEIKNTFGISHRSKFLWKYFPSIAPINIFVCTKNI